MRTVKQMVLDQLAHMIETRKELKAPAANPEDKAFLDTCIWTLEEVVAYVETLPND